jgi:hypothetical protein
MLASSSTLLSLTNVLALIRVFCLPIKMLGAKKRFPRWDSRATTKIWLEVLNTVRPLKHFISVDDMEPNT